MTVHIDHSPAAEGVTTNGAQPSQGVQPGPGIRSLSALREAVDDGRITKVLLVAADNIGRPLGEHFPARRFLDHVDDYTAFRIPLMVWQLDIEQDLNPDLEHVGGLSNGGPDCFLKPDLNTLRVLPWIPDTAFVICDPILADGSVSGDSPPADPQAAVGTARLAWRHRPVRLRTGVLPVRPELRKQLGVRLRKLTPASRIKAAYDPLVAVRNEPFINAVVDQMDIAGVEIEALSCEYGIGQQEINLTHTNALEMADRHFIYKFGVKTIATRMGKSATFMAKWDGADVGQLLSHPHQSLVHRRVNPVGGRRTFRRFRRRPGGRCSRHVPALCTKPELLPPVPAELLCADDGRRAGTTTAPWRSE